MNIRYKPLIDYMYQKELEINSSSLGVSAAVVNNIKHNKKITDKSLHQISKKLGISVVDIVEPMPTNDYNPIAKPFVKWLGGKRRLYKHIKMHLPKSYNRYIEPFVGGGSVLFMLQPTDAIINDKNKELINIYRLLKSKKAKDIQNMLDQFEESATKNRKQFYNDIRAMDINEPDLLKENKIISAARFLFLNKNGYNGVYRVNSQGYYNVPYNKAIKQPNYDYNNLDKISEYLSSNNIKIYNQSYQKIVEIARPGDFIYLDPPYDSDENDSFVQYTKDGFTKDDTIELAKLCKELDKKGCFFLLSNHSTKLVLELFDEFKKYEFNVKRSINSVVEKRRSVNEILIYNYEIEESISS